MRNTRPPSPVPRADPAAALAALAQRIWERAEAVDAAAAIPAADLADLAASGLLAAPLPRDRGGDGLGLDAAGGIAARDVLTTIGRASLTVGRLFEGHLNAVKLAAHYGGGGLAVLAREIAAGRPSGVWNAERGDGVVATRTDDGYSLRGRKIHCSGAGTIRRPVVTAKVDGEPLMLLPDLAGAAGRVDLGVWRAAGMRGTATGTVDFDGLVVAADAVIGGRGDYYRAPLFSGGAWRVIAVQLGGLDRIMVLHAERLHRGGGADPVVRARFAVAAGAHESARLLVAEAARRAEAPGDPGAIDAYVGLARGTFEALALTVIENTRRNIGLTSFIAPDPLDRVLRDLDTYLRQPFLDASRDQAASWLIAREGRFDA